MRTLAIECATQACSVALFDNDTLIANEHRILGRGHAEHLVPMIAALPDRGRADRIVVSRGPGSFTGVRIGIAAARALGIAWGADVRGYPTLALVARMGLDLHGDPSQDGILAVMAGGHGEWFMQPFSSAGTPLDVHRSLLPKNACATYPCTIVAGSQANAYRELVPAATAFDLLPDARHVLRIGPDMFGMDTAPIYGRAPDAKLPV